MPLDPKITKIHNCTPENPMPADIVVPENETWFHHGIKMQGVVVDENNQYKLTCPNCNKEETYTRGQPIKFTQEWVDQLRANRERMRELGFKPPARTK